MKRILLFASTLLLVLLVAVGPAAAQSPLDDDEVLDQVELPGDPVPIEDDEPAPADEDEVAATTDSRPEVVAASDDELAYTGFEVTTGAALAVALLGAGASALVVAKRRTDRA